MEAGQGPGGGEVGEPHEVRAALGTRPGCGGEAAAPGSPHTGMDGRGAAARCLPVPPGALPARRALEAGPGSAMAPLLPPGEGSQPHKCWGGGRVTGT